jgi:hypothetical protein
VTIALSLIGCTAGFRYNLSAEQALDAIAAWFNDPANSAARRAQITRVDLICPTHHKGKGDQMDETYRTRLEAGMGVSLESAKYFTV